jgi:hypothetical protein
MQGICFLRAVALVVVANLLLPSFDLRAEGALALGLPNNVAKEGFAYGYTVNKATLDEAHTAALDFCRTSENGSKPGQALCRVVETFSGKCVVIAMDPKAGTPGIGWAVDEDIAAAEARAMSYCKATAGADRVEFCKVDKSGCDKPQ